MNNKVKMGRPPKGPVQTCEKLAHRPIRRNRIRSGAQRKDSELAAGSRGKHATELAGLQANGGAVLTFVLAEGVGVPDVDGCRGNRCQGGGRKDAAAEKNGVG